jgi:hypothetical protein
MSFPNPLLGAQGVLASFLFMVDNITNTDAFTCVAD